MTRLTAQEIEAIRKRAESATEGPWKWDGDSLTYRKHGMLDPIVWANQYGDITVEEPDAEFIANAREDIPKLLAEVEALRNALKPDDTTLMATNQRLQADLKEAESIALWSARRLPQTYKSFAYDAIDELFGGKAERL